MLKRIFVARSSLHVHPRRVFPVSERPGAFGSCYPQYDCFRYWRFFQHSVFGAIRSENETITGFIFPLMMDDNVVVYGVRTRG